MYSTSIRGILLRGTHRSQGGTSFLRKIFLDNTINWYQREADERSIIVDTWVSRRRFLRSLASGTALVFGGSGCYGFLQSTSRSQVAFFFSSRRRHTRYWRDWSSDVCSSD